MLRPFARGFKQRNELLIVKTPAQLIIIHERFKQIFVDCFISLFAREQYGIYSDSPSTRHSKRPDSNKFSFQFL